MTIKITPDQVDNARLLLALDRADGRTSDDWIMRLASAKPAGAEPAGATPIGEVVAPSPPWFRPWGRNLRR